MILYCEQCHAPMRARLISEELPGVALRKDGPAETMTLVGYWSPPGHRHDDNCLKRTYVCWNGHAVIVSKRRRCHACDWVGKATCPCHDGDKVDEWPEELSK